MTDPRFDKAFWDEHWRGTGGGAMATSPPNLHLIRETEALPRGTALDAGCGAGAEALWLAAQGWQVTGVDLATEALQRAAARMPADVAARMAWAEADLTRWTPERPVDLVTTHYAHPTMPQLDFYERLGGWVALGGTLLVVAHAARERGHEHAPAHEPRHGHTEGRGDTTAQPVVTAEAICARFDAERWEVMTSAEVTRELPRPGRSGLTLDDVVVRLRRRR